MDLPVELKPGPFRLQRAEIERAISDLLNVDEKAALLIVGERNGDTSKARIVYAHRLPSGWKFIGEAAFDGKVSGKISVLRTW